MAWSFRGLEPGLPPPWSGDIDEVTLDTQKESGTSEGQTHGRRELGFSVPGPMKGLSMHLHRWMEKRYGVREKENKRDVKTLEKYTRLRKKDSLKRNCTPGPLRTMYRR